jgi:hypothetical protein
MSFGQYIKLLTAVMASSGLLLGVVLGGVLLSQGEMSANIDLTLDFGPLDGLWFPLLVPLLAIVLTVLLSPLSYPLYRLLSSVRN